MQLNPLKIAKSVNEALKNRDRLKAKVDELRANPLTAKCGGATVTYDIDSNRVAKIECADVDLTLLENIRSAVNLAFDKSDQVWAEVTK